MALTRISVHVYMYMEYTIFLTYFNNENMHYNNSMNYAYYY